MSHFIVKGKLTKYYFILIWAENKKFRILCPLWGDMKYSTAD